MARAPKKKTKKTGPPTGALAQPIPEGWKLADGRFKKTFTFESFVEAFAFMAKCALTAEKLDHHPAWRNVWNTVEVELWTHSANTITSKDFELARAMNVHAGE